MVRCFEDENVHHVNGKIDSINDIDTINFELALADIGQIEKRQERLAKTRPKSKEEETALQVRSRPRKVLTLMDILRSSCKIGLSIALPWQMDM